MDIAEAARLHEGKAIILRGTGNREQGHADPGRDMIEDIVRRYADPAYAPDWLADQECPEWETHTPEQRRAFAAHVNRLLDELEDRAKAERAKELEPELTPAMLAKLGEGVAVAGVRLAAQAELHPGLSINELAKLERRAKEQAATGKKRRGPTKADPSERTHLPAALAARDVRRMRDVIFPRFWGRKNRALKPTAEEIAAARHGTTPSAVKARLEKPISISRNIDGE